MCDSAQRLCGGWRPSALHNVPQAAGMKRDGGLLGVSLQLNRPASSCIAPLHPCLQSLHAKQAAQLGQPVVSDQALLKSTTSSSDTNNNRELQELLGKKHRAKSSNTGRSRSLSQTFRQVTASVEVCRKLRENMRRQSLNIYQ